MPAVGFLRRFLTRLAGPPVAAAWDRPAGRGPDPAQARAHDAEGERAASLQALQQAADAALTRFDAREIRLSYDGGSFRFKPWKAFAMPKLEEARARVRGRLTGGMEAIGLDDLTVEIDVEMDRHIAYGQGATVRDAVVSLSRR